MNGSVHGVGKVDEPSCTGGLSSIVLTCKVAKMLACAVYPNRRLPLPLVFLPTHPSMDRSASNLTGNVLGVLGKRQDSQVATAVIQAISVDVVALPKITIEQSQQLSVKSDPILLPAFSRGPNDVASATETPRPLSHPVSVSGIDGGMSHNLTASREQRKARNLSVYFDARQVAQAASLVRTVLRAVHPVSATDPIDARQEVNVADRADCWNGTLSTHHGSLQVRGVRPRTVQPVSGLLALNYTLTRREAARV